MLVVIPAFDLHVNQAITLVTADLIYKFAASALPLWVFCAASMGLHITHTGLVMCLTHRVLGYVLCGAPCLLHKKPKGEEPMRQTYKLGLL